MNSQDWTRKYTSLVFVSQCQGEANKNKSCLEVNGICWVKMNVYSVVSIMKYFQYSYLLHLLCTAASFDRFLSVSDDSVSPAASEHLDPEQEASVSRRAEGGTAGEDFMSEIHIRYSESARQSSLSVLNVF